MRKLIIITLLLPACTAKDSSGGVCKVTTDCQSGLFCVGSVCKANTGSNLACTSDTDCKPQEACVSAKCGNFGCDASHPCNDGCCNGTQCVAVDACTGGLTCASNGACPARCDTASGGAGCTSGCCDTANGKCESGTQNTDCGGSGSACVSCAGGSTCTSQTCLCTACTGTTVCGGSGCVDCSTHPCSGNTPFCDGTTDPASTHSCQSCKNGGVGFCMTNFPSTPYCDEGGNCSTTPDSSQACADADPNNPILVSAAVCGCTAQVTCPNNFVCDTSTSTCFTTCDADTSTGCASGYYCPDGISCALLLTPGQLCNANGDCASGFCDCGEPGCAPTTRVCSAGPTACPACTYADGSGTCSVSNLVNPGTTTFNCDASGCATGACECAGGACLSDQGQSCTAPTDCASGFCNATSIAGGYGICGATACECSYADSDGTCTNNPVSSGTFTQGCTPTGADCTSLGGDCCNGGGDGPADCLVNDGGECSGPTDCLSGFCAFSSSAGTHQYCIPSANPCPTCQYPILQAGWDGTTCPAGTSCPSMTCDDLVDGAFCSGGECNGGSCESSGTCSVSCGTCSNPSNSSTCDCGETPTDLCTGGASPKETVVTACKMAEHIIDHGGTITTTFYCTGSVRCVCDF